MKFPLLFAAAAAQATALAQEGHGLAGSHWHATDTLGLMLGAAGIGLAVWLSRGGK